MGKNKESQEAPTYLPTGDWAGLRYPLAGDGVFAVESLSHYFASASRADLLFVLEEQLFRSLGPLWRHNHTASDFFLWRSYDPILPVNLFIEPLLYDTPNDLVDPELTQILQKSSIEPAEIDFDKLSLVAFNSKLLIMRHSSKWR